MTSVEGTLPDIKLGRMAAFFTARILLPVQARYKSCKCKHAYREKPPPLNKAEFITNFLR